jgi:chorismate synthase
MAPESDAPGEVRRRAVTRPRPGHADLVGVLKYDRRDARDVLERASARETAARTACGAVCKVLLSEFDIEIGSHVVELGGVVAAPPDPLPAPLNAAADASAVRCLDPPPNARWWTGPRRARAALGGVAEVVARVSAGLAPTRRGTAVSTAGWRRR